MIRLVLACLAVSVLCLPTLAADHHPGNRMPDKTPTPRTPPVHAPDILRQGGDTVATAFPISAPYQGIGHTDGYTDDYDEDCPWSSTSPDVVYALTVPYDMLVDIDLCGSAYDTKVYVFDETLDERLACNDDFYDSGDPCGRYVSKIEGMPAFAGELYYVVIDGFGGDAGGYVLEITEYVPCSLDCPVGAVLEDEPPLTEGYDDQHNGGCGAYPEPIFQPVDAPVFCGVAGWYVDGSSQLRDTDWFVLQIPAGGVLEVVGDAEFETYLIESGPPDCDQAGVLQDTTIGPCNEGGLTVTGEPGDTIWLGIASRSFSSPNWLPDVAEYDYILWTNLGPVATERNSLSEVKALFE